MQLTIKGAVCLIVVFFETILLTGCFKEVELNHPDDPGGKYYIKATGNTQGCENERKSLTTALIRWEWSYPDSIGNADQVIIERYKLEDSIRIDPIDFAIDFPIDSAGDCWEWKDTLLEFETTYEYDIWLARDEITAKDSIPITYFHGFIPIDTNSIFIEQIKSDTSIHVSWVNSDTIANSIEFIWLSVSNDTLSSKIIVNSTPIDSTGTIEIVLNNKYIEFGAIKVQIRYGYSDDDTTLWQKRPAERSYTMVFDSVKSLYVVPFLRDQTKRINRITWRYDSTNVEPDEFEIKRDDVAVATVPNTLSAKQTILSRQYFTYYDTVESEPLKYKVIPKTSYHDGRETTYDNPTYAVPNGYMYVDRSYGSFGEGFYIGLYEVSVGEFLNTYNVSFSRDTSFFVQHSTGKGAGFQPSSNGLELVITGSDNLPIDSLDWYLADSMAKLLGGRLPSREEWELAARASSNDERFYPWGNISPTTDICNFGKPSRILFPVDSLEFGRVKVFPYQTIRGPFHMSGNIREWTKTTFPARGVISNITKGGNWHDNESLIKIDSNMPFSASDPVAGFRIVKSIDEMIRW